MKTVWIVSAIALGVAAVLFLTLRKGNKPAKQYRVRQVSDWEIQLGECPAKIAEQFENLSKGEQRHVAIRES